MGSSTISLILLVILSTLVSVQAEHEGNPPGGRKRRQLIKVGGIISQDEEDKHDPFENLLIFNEDNAHIMRYLDTGFSLTEPPSYAPTDDPAPPPPTEKPTTYAPTPDNPASPSPAPADVAPSGPVKTDVPSIPLKTDYPTYTAPSVPVKTDVPTYFDKTDVPSYPLKTNYPTVGMPSAPVKTLAPSMTTKTDTPTKATTSMPSGAPRTCPPVPDAGCSVCGDNMCVTKPDAIFSFPDQPAVPCILLQDAGEGGLIPQTECSFLPDVIEDICGCASPDDTAPPQPTPVPPPTPVDAGSCPSIPTGGCSICGENKCVTKPDEIFIFPDQPTVPCGTLEDAGKGGLIPQTECSFLPELIGDLCGCASLDTAPTPPSAAPIPAPVDAGSCPSIPTGGCSICGENKCVTRPDAIFTFPGQPDVACGRLEDAGEDGLVPLDECPFLPELTADVCGCALSDSLAPTPAPTPAPVFDGSCPSIPDGGCSICGDDKCITKPDVIFEFPGQPSVSCGRLQAAGAEGLVPLDECLVLPGFVVDLCGCKSASTPEPTPAPVFGGSCPSIPDGGCSICGDDKCVTKPDEIFEFPGQPSVSCGRLQAAGAEGLVPLNECEVLPDFLDDVCGCESASTPEPTPAPVFDGSCPSIPDGGCSICGDDKCVTKPDEIFEFPGQPSVSCGRLQAAGADGLVPLDECEFLPDFVNTVCGCVSASTPAPTPAPTPQATPGPTPESTPGPTPGPTPESTPGPTPGPTPGSTPGPTPGPTPGSTPGPTPPPTPEATPAPTAAPEPEPAPVSTGGCPSIPTNGCSICGTDKCITMPDEIFSFPGQPSVPCGVLQLAGEAGQIPLNQCGFLPGLVDTLCGCA